MKKKNIFILSGILCFGLASSFQTADFKKAEATSNLETIGTLFKIQHVTTTTKVYVLGDYLQWATLAGRTIYQELMSGSKSKDEKIPCDYSCEQQGNEKIPPLIRYYYYATPEEPKIIDAKTMYNDVESLVYALEYLEDEANYLSISDVNNAILAYIRRINKNYTDQETTYYSPSIYSLEKWESVCGPENANFISGMNSYYQGGLKIKEYFSSFLEVSSLYNSQEYGECSSTFLNKNLKLIDPLTNSASIDMIHMFAAFDGIADNTGASLNDWPYYYVPSLFYKYLVSWGGDLQTLAVEATNKPSLQLNTSLSALLNDTNNTTYNLFDYLANMDAYNMSRNLNLLDSSTVLSSIVETYYYHIDYGMIVREEEFVSKVIQDRPADWTTEKSLKVSIFSLLKLDENGNDIPSSFIGLTGDLIFYHLLTGSSYNARLYLANMFYNTLVDYC